MSQIQNHDGFSSKINDEIARLSKIEIIDTNEISDGFHTFGELYEHRITLFIALAKLSGNAWRSHNHSDGTSWDGWFIMGIGKEPGK